MWGGGIALGLLAFGLEWRQQYLPGRIGDITTVMLMVATWFFVWRLVARRRLQVSSAASVVPAGTLGRFG
jgi:hypothetical protein